MTHATDTAGYAMIAKPSLAQRFWRRVGFRYHLGDEPEGTDGLQGWSHNRLEIDFHWSDRLRMLLTGRLRIVFVQAYDAPSPTIIKNRLDWHILAPGDFGKE